MPGPASLLTDIRVELTRADLRPIYQVAMDKRRVASRGGVLSDIGTVSGHDNLGQAIALRLLTPLGELSELGHPEYGSRLPSLIGDKNDEARRGLARLYVLESLSLEPRIEEVVEVRVDPSPGQRTGIDILVKVRPVGSSDVVRIGPFTLELEA